MAVGFAIFDKWLIQQDAASVIAIGATESYTKLFRIVGMTLKIHLIYSIYIFTAEPLWAKWNVLRILRWRLNRMLVHSSTVSADGDFSVAVIPCRPVELSLNIRRFLIWIVLCCMHS